MTTGYDPTVNLEVSATPLTHIKRGFKIFTVNPNIVTVSLSGLAYRNTFSLAAAEVDITTDFEDTTFVDSETEHVLAKPWLLIVGLHETEGVSNTQTVNVELQWAVNAVDYGKLKLDGYTQLCRVLLNPEEFGWAWHSVGLIPRGLRVMRAVDGSRIAPELKSRLLLRSMFCTFTYLGALHNGLG